MIIKTNKKLLMQFSNKGNPKLMFILGILFSMILAFLLIVPVCATDSQTENNAIPFQTISGTPLSPTIQENINTAIAEEKDTQKRINQAIIERERLLSEDLLEINDGNATKIMTVGIVIKTKDNTHVSNENSESTSYSGSEIPVGSIINFGNDGKTRIFA